jgi:2-polyprenyl-3-methyl-5-hydroxy-6-metoxy-1,4-benzoquinol methylase|tara:strand:- start:367 stop:1263 length:897 start_codon:yes stop_codon:yes gene_type:complete
MTDQEIIENIKKYNWYHEIKIKEGIVTTAVDAFEVDGKYETYSSSKDHWNQRNIFSALDKIDFKNKKVLDIGCRDGLFSFYAEKRGASEIVGIDNDLSKGATEFLIPYFNSKVKMYQKNVYDITEEDYGKFDIIIFVGVLYHLRYPFYSLKKLKEVLNKDGKLIIETGILLDDNKRAMLYCPIEDDSEYEKTSCTFFNVKGLSDSLKSMGIFVENVFIYPQKIRFRVTKNIIKFFLNIIFRKKYVFGIKTDLLGKYDQHIGSKVGPITRGIFVSNINEKLIKEYATNYWDKFHTFHSR